MRALLQVDGTTEVVPFPFGPTLTVLRDTGSTVLMGQARPSMSRQQDRSAILPVRLSRAFPGLHSGFVRARHSALARERIIAANFLVLEVIVRFPSLSRIVLALIFAAVSVSSAQNRSVQVPPLGPKSDPADSPRLKMEREMAKKANQARQADLTRDTERLVISTELKDYVDKTNENMLSVDVVKKAEEIEKLAHSVKEKMKGN